MEFPFKMVPLQVTFFHFQGGYYYYYCIPLYTIVHCFMHYWLSQTFWDYIFHEKNKVQTFISWSFGWVRFCLHPFHFHQPPNRELSTTRYHLSGEGSSYHDMPRSRPKQRPKAKGQSELDRSSVAKTEAKTCAFQTGGTGVSWFRTDSRIPGYWNLRLGGGFKYFLFSSLFGEDSHFD